MPTYEFRCPKGHDFEKFYKTMSSAPLEVPCPECGAVAARQLSGGGGLVFKGSGFYLTDYGKNAHRKSGSESSDGGGAKAETKSESKGDSGAAPAPRADTAKSEKPAPKADTAPAKKSKPKSE